MSFVFGQTSTFDFSLPFLPNNQSGLLGNANQEVSMSSLEAPSKQILTTSSKTQEGNQSKIIKTDEDFKKYPEMRYYLNEELSDVWFVINGVKIPANKTFLSVKSEVFGAQFSGNFSDSEAKEIVVEETTIESFTDMLRFLHKDVLELNDNKSIDYAMDVFYLADKYQLIRLMECLNEHIKGFLNKMNFEEISQFVRKYGVNNRKDCLEERVGQLLSPSAMKGIIGFAIENGLNNLLDKCKEYLAQNIPQWLDRDINELLAINAMTDNTLLHVIILKMREPSFKAKLKENPVQTQVKHLFPVRP